MTPEQLEQLAELITQKIIDEFDRRIAEKIQPMTPDEFFHHQVEHGSASLIYLIIH